MTTGRLRVIVTGLIAQHPSLAGVAWDYLQYPVGLHRLGHDVYYIEDSGEWPYTLDGGATGHDWVAADCRANVEHLAAVMERFGLADRWAYRFPVESRWFGLPDATRREVLQTADLLINVSGTIERPTEYRSVNRLAYIDSDPVFTQVKLALGGPHTAFRERVAAHDVHFSFGECLSAAVPDTPYTWVPTRQPILLDAWRRPPAPRQAYTTVMSWTSYEPLRHEGRSYGQKDVEFARFLDLPRVLPDIPCEVALNATEHVSWESATDPAAAPGPRLSPRLRLEANGWRVVESRDVCGDLDTYRGYLGSSRGEWSVAKHGYVAGRPGWFSGRSACYLASGRPVVVQDTGFTDVLPTGLGVLAFSSLDQAAAALEAVESDYARHASAARALADAYFDADKVLTDLVERAMATTPPPRTSGAHA